MKKILALAFVLVLSSQAFAADNAVIVTPGTGVTMKSKDIGLGVQAMQPILSDASGNTLLTTVGADAVSNTLTGIPVYSRMLQFNGTTWDRWQGAVTNAGTFAVQPASATAPVSTMNSASAAAGVTAANAFVFDDVSPTAITENNFGYARMSANRNQYHVIRDAAGNERGANVNASSQLTVSVDGGSALNANGRATSANSSPMVPSPAPTTWHLIAAATTNATSVKGSAATLFSCQLGGVGSTPAFLKIYNKATAPTVGTDTPVKTLIIPAASTAANGAGSNINFGPGGLTLGTGFAAAVTGVMTDADTTAVAAATFAINCDYE